MSGLQYAPHRLAPTPLPPGEAPAAAGAPTATAIAIRSLHLINGEHYSGAERVQDHLARQLPQFGISLDFASLKRGKFASMRQAVETPLYEFPMRHRLDFAVVKPIVHLVYRKGYHLLHAHTPRSALIAAKVARRTGLPWVYHVHSPVTRDSERWLRNQLNAIAEARSLRGASRVIVVSPSLWPYMHQRGIDPARVACVPNGVPASLQPRPSGLPEGDWTIGMVALFRPRKGVELLLEALHELTRRKLPVRLRGVGAFETASYEQSIHQIVARLGLDDRVEWTGFTRDVASELARLDILALPSLFGEGLPMVLLEAMAAGLPAVVSDVEGASAAVVDGQTGLIVPPGDATRLADSLEALIAGRVDYPAMATAARERHAKEFSDVAMAQGVAQVYESLLPQSL